MVFTPMESSPSSKLRFFDESGAEIPSPVEGSKCGIAIDVVQESWANISLKLGTHSLEVFFDKEKSLAHCEWPACGPGHYELYLVCGDHRERRRITLMPKYFTESDISCVINELTETLPKSIALQLLRCGGQLGALDHKPSVEEEYSELRRALLGSAERLGLLQVLPIIQRECHHELVPRIEVRDSDKVRRPDISKLPGVISMPGNVLSPEVVFRMYDVAVESSFDTYENRLVKAYVQALRGRLSRLQGRIEHAPKEVGRDIDNLINDFNLACARATFLREVKLPTVFTGRVTMVLLKNPSYRLVFEDYLALNQQSSVTLSETALRDSLKQFPYLYELWANLRVLNAMLQVCVELGFQCVSHNWVKKNSKGIFIQVINDEQTAIELVNPKNGKRATLVSWKPDGGNEVLEDTPNHERLIALAIVIDSPGEQSKLLVFDPEYRVAFRNSDSSENEVEMAKSEDAGSAVSTSAKGKKKSTASSKREAVKLEVLEARNTIEPMKEDVADLMRWVEVAKAPDSPRTLEYAAMLYPGPRMQFGSGVEALPALPSDGDGLQKPISDVLRRYLA